MRFNWPWKIERRLHPQISHTIFHDLEVNGNDTSHLNGTTKGDFAVSLGEMKISDAELGTLDVDREIHFATTAQVLNIAVSAVLGTS